MEYKLIKEYPGSPKLGAKVSENNKYMWYGDEFFLKYPEFYEKIVEKTYKILKSCPIEGTIYKVKRLSDDVVFIVGDKIKRTGYNDVNVIRGFNEDKNGYILVSISDKIDEGYFGKKGVNISAIEHVKDVLFTTEDGVDITKSTTCFAVSSHFGIYETNINEYVSKEWYSGKKIFYSREKAEEHILMNKPCLSINDLKSWGVISVDTLVKLVKQKL